ncbi:MULTISPECIES: rhomboid family intramembrane serine protease [unclassified Chelatococcus]|jgi:membrane associated rhomboid family serine protease|uniref:rhomboid family intramembrane serine protease n=1 Tax=unclassified Chelatococcus TaxID=2638111 RepID=UPI001BD1077F|nr:MULTISPECIES: rhomboid family intramembrane serine protease [unclassified Chelatococcus]CAH1664116.1 Membrane associated rhomboid family serine protease [Hyphomicrobiales bacterium]MBS7741660.1 rhomboid family intramembrane serine protease [Chelatococcus sp. HY11]MBX3544321.1 rhomboid family intramembrane serine protease [Chelatococcus sp.]MCO5079155.1 rhomboid family intramembrane serine protease [Chelatococcus sp.]CAH1681942.1 Membrane associated rhomboid family serine protease [Hyphomicr
MFVPLYDGVPMRNIRVPYVTYAILIVSTLIYGVVALDRLPMPETSITAAFGLIPAVFFGDVVLPEELSLVPVYATPVTSLFLHVGFLHLLGNMLFLFVFGDNVEDALGHFRFLLFFALCGAASGLAYAFSVPDSERPLVGASGAVSGVISAYLILHPRVRVWGLFFFRIPLHLRAYWAIGFWLLIQIAQIWINADDSVGWVAHVGGFAAGIILVIILRRKNQPLLGAGDGPQLTGDV